MNAGWIVLIVFSGLLLLSMIIVCWLLPLKSYFTALFSGCYVSVRKLISMRQRKMPVYDIVSAYILAKKAKLDVALKDLESIYEVGGNPARVVEGMVAGSAVGLNLTLEIARKVDFTGQDAVELVKDCINTKIIETPWATSLACDLQEINAKLKLTVKGNFKHLTSGVGLETLLSRANECVVAKIAGARDHKTILQNPLLLSKAVFDGEIDSDTFYEIVSVDVLEVSLGNNIALKREKEKLEKEHLIEMNRIEERRLVAQAVEQEMKAKAQEMKVKLLEQEMEVPKAIAKAVEEGKMDNLIDFYKLENLQADTQMRKHLSGQLPEE